METYDEFINNILETRGRFNCGEEYHERHHIKPRCLGGDDDEDNLIDLFAREHFKAHMLLALENPNTEDLVYAWWMMSNVEDSNQERYELTAEEYEEVKKYISRIQSVVSKTRWLDDDFRNKVIEKHKLRWQDDDFRKKHHEGMQKAIDKLSKIAKKRTGTKNGFFNKHHTQETKDKLRELRSIPALQFSIEGVFIQTWDCAKDVEMELGICAAHIGECKKRKALTAGGYVWRDVGDCVTDEDLRKLKNKEPKYVHYSSTKQRYIASKYINGKKKQIGSFKTEEEALVAVKNFIQQND